MTNIDELDSIDVKKEIRKIEKNDEYVEPEKLPVSFDGAYEFIESLPFEDEIRAFTEYYENRISAISKYKSKYLMEKEINRVLEVLNKRLNRIDIPEEMRFVYEDMVKDLPYRILDESLIFSYKDIKDIKENTKVK